MQIEPNDNPSVSGRLLVVDDEVEICQMLQRHFLLLGYDVETASNGETALQILSSNLIDIMISDIVMPKMNGVELLKEVSISYPMVRTIMITGYVTLEHALACMRKKADMLVFKPFNDLNELENAVVVSMGLLNNWKSKLQELGHFNSQRRIS